jgi:hypothetical protein
MLLPLDRIVPVPTSIVADGSFPLSREVLGAVE